MEKLYQVLVTPSSKFAVTSLRKDNSIVASYLKPSRYKCLHQSFPYPSSLFHLFKEMLSFLLKVSFDLASFSKWNVCCFHGCTFWKLVLQSLHLVPNVLSSVHNPPTHWNYSTKAAIPTFLTGRSRDPLGLMWHNLSPPPCVSFVTTASSLKFSFPWFLLIASDRSSQALPVSLLPIL